MRVILHPIFLGCRDSTNDLFWKKIFENLAYGDTPRGIYFKDNTLYSLTKKKEFNYNFSEKDAETVYNDVHSLLGNLYGLKSKGDLSRKRQIFEEFQKLNSIRKGEELWGKIKRKSLRDNLIQDYVVNVKKIYELPDKEIKKLYFYITVGCVFKLFSGNDIILKGGFIESIDGVSFSDKKVLIHRRFEEPQIKREADKVIYLYALWENYLKTLD